MEILVTIITFSGEDQRKVTEELFGYYPDPENRDLLCPYKIQARNGVIIKAKGGYDRETIGAPQDTYILLDIAKDIGVGIVSAFLYDRLKNISKVKIKIGNKEVDIIKEEIEKAIWEALGNKESRKS